MKVWRRPPFVVLKSKFDSELLHHLLLCSHSPKDAPPPPPPPPPPQPQQNAPIAAVRVRPNRFAVTASNGRVDLYILRRATVYQDVMKCFKLHFIILHINCALMRHGFHSLHLLSKSNKYFKRKQMFKLICDE